MPRPLGAEATYQVANGQLRLAVPYPAAAPLDQAYFFAASHRADRLCRAADA